MKTGADIPGEKSGPSRKDSAHLRTTGSRASERPKRKRRAMGGDGVDAAIVLLAAGEGRRFGDAKQLAMLNGEPMVRRSARLLLETSAPVIVVTGARADDVEAALADLPVHRVRNAAWQEGMGTSLAAGFRYALEHFENATGALLCLADQPLADAELPIRMLRRHAQAPDQLLAIAHVNLIGPPVLFPRDCFAELSEWSGHAGAQAILRREAQRLETFAADLLPDVDTPADLERAAKHLRHAKIGG